MGPRETGQRIEQLLEEVRTLTTPQAWARVDELLRTVLELYGTGMARVVEIASEQGSADELRARLIADPLLTNLFVLHGVHPLDARTRVERVLAHVEGSLGVHVELLAFDETILRLRLPRGGHASSLAAVRAAIERAVQETAPEVGTIEFEEEKVEPLIQLNGRKKQEGAWAEVAGLGKIASGELKSVQVDGHRVVVCSVSGSLYAVRDTCAACGSALGTGGLEGQLLRCPSCGQRYDLRLAGRAVDGRPLHLDAFPLLADATGVRIALP